MWTGRTTVIGAATVTALSLVVAPAWAAEPADATVVPIQVTGDPAKRFNLVLIGDGYTTADMPKFRTHLAKHLNDLWTIEGREPGSVPVGPQRRAPTPSRRRSPTPRTSSGTRLYARRPR